MGCHRGKEWTHLCLRVGLYFFSITKSFENNLLNRNSFKFSDARNMAREVRDIILEAIETQGNKSKQEAENYLKRMESQRRYSADVWS